MAGKSFFEILEDQIRREVTNEVRAEFEAHYKEMASSLKTSPLSEPTKTSASKSATKPTVETWLLTHFDKMTFKTPTSAGTGQYKTQARAFSTEPKHISAKEQTAPPVYEPPRTNHSFSPEQLWAYGFFVRQGEKLAENFVEKELKAAYRKLALKLHPDQAQNEKAPGHFHSLAEAYQILSDLFKA